MSADHITFDAAIRYARLDGQGAKAPLRYDYHGTLKVTLEIALKTCAVISRRHGYSELVDLYSRTVIAVFLFGHQIAVNRQWRDEYDPTFRVSDSENTAPEAQKEIS